MPWLIKDEEDPSNNLLFFHVPRCGGTSLTKHFKVSKKCRKGMWPWRRFGMMYWFYRYRLLETANFPFKTWENLIAVCEFIVATALISTLPAYSDDHECSQPNSNCGPGVAAYVMYSTGSFMFLTSTFFAVAPVIGRNFFWRRFYAVLVTYVLCNFTGCEEWLTGCNIKGWFIHFTAAKALKHDLIKPEDLDTADSFAIVRNPYSRMVSVYMYNRFGKCESFDSFVRDWCKNKLAIYKKTGSTEEWDIYCHAVPQFEFTHLNGKQIVKCIIKQEELKKLWFPGLVTRSLRHEKRLREIPEKVANALRGMPHANARKRSKPWWDYYTQETANLVAETYAADFAIFNYEMRVPNRHDLDAPPTKKPKALRPFSSNIDFSFRDPKSILEQAKEPSKRLEQVLEALNETTESQASVESSMRSEVDLESGSSDLSKVEESAELALEDGKPVTSEVSATTATTSTTEPPEIKVEGLSNEAQGQEQAGEPDTPASDVASQAAQAKSEGSLPSEHETK